MGNKPVEKPNEFDVVRKGQNTKDTKTWCKGVVGREHHGEWVQQGRSAWSYTHFICTVCGRKLAYHGEPVIMHDALTQLRKAKGWNQQELADEVNRLQIMPYHDGDYHKGRIPCTAEIISNLEHGSRSWFREQDLSQMNMYSRVFKALDFKIVYNLVEIEDKDRNTGEPIPYWLPSGHATTKEE